MVEVYRTAFELFGLTVRWYGLLVVAGIALGVALAGAREKRMGLPKDTTIDLALVCVPAAIAGARLYYVVFSWEQFAGRPWWKMLAVWEGGMAIYGGLIAGLLAGVVWAKRKKIPFLKLADLAAPSVALGQAVGRWGNFVNQEAHGAPVANPTLRFFPVAVEIGGEWMYATFFYESVWCLLIVAVLLTAERKNAFFRSGDGFFTYVFLYALERTVVEGMRTDSLYIGPMRVSQGLSLLAAMAVAVLAVRRCGRVPGLLRISVPAAVAAAGIAAACGSFFGTLTAAAAALAAAAVMIRMETKRQMMQNRGETK